MQPSLMNRYYWWIVAVIIGLLLMYSILNLTTKPIPWKDEATAIEGSYNFTLFQRLSVYLAPGEFVQYPFFVIASGPPLTLPLAAIFKIFGFGLLQARAYMLLWIIGFLIATAYITRKLFGASAGIFALLLITTFTPFHAYGRTMVGELPGALFVLLSAYFLAVKGRYWLGGFFVGIAIAMRPSEYLVLVPAIVVWWILQRKKVKDIFKVGVAAMPGVLSFILFEFPHFLNLATWKIAIALYQNPFGEEGSSATSFRTLITSSTIIYFALFAAIIGTTYFFLWRKHEKWQSFVLLAGLFILFNILYFLRSPGWFRYLFPSQILLLILIAPAIESIISRVNSTRIAYGIISGLIILQLINFIWLPTIKSSNNIEIMKNYLTGYLHPGEQVFVINDPLLAAILEPSQKYNTFIFTGVPIQGKNQLANTREKLPQLVIYRNYIPENKQFIDPYQNVIDRNYHEISNLGQKGYTILERN